MCDSIVCVILILIITIQSIQCVGKIRTNSCNILNCQIYKLSKPISPQTFFTNSKIKTVKMKKNAMKITFGASHIFSFF